MEETKHKRKFLITALISLFLALILLIPALILTSGEIMVGVIAFDGIGITLLIFYFFEKKANLIISILFTLLFTIFLICTFVVSDEFIWFAVPCFVVFFSFLLDYLKKKISSQLILPTLAVFFSFSFMLIWLLGERVNSYQISIMFYIMSVLFPIVGIVLGVTSLSSGKENEKQHKICLGLSISLAILVGLASALFPNSLRGNWWLQQPYSTDGDNPDITVYEPFNGEKTAQLDEPATLILTENLPIMDGALALYPVYAAIAQAVYDKTAYGTGESTPFTNTLRAFNSLIAGERDIIFSSHASEKQIKAAKDAGVELVHTPIGKEAFVFLVGNKNPIENLSSQQIYNIYSGKTAKWRTLGWDEGGNIIAFQRPEGSGSQTGIQTLMHDARLPLIVPQPLPDKSLVGTNSLMKQISVEWKGVQPALGYSYKFFATQMYPNPEVKLLSIDDIEPSAENIASGAYPFTVEFYAITNGVPTGNTKILLDWILSSQGQTLIEKVGYAPINSHSTEIEI